jgi:hypothetical protein
VEFLYILNTLVLGFFLWDIHKGQRVMATQLAAQVEHVAEIAREISAKTDEILRRSPSSRREEPPRQA